MIRIEGLSLEKFLNTASREGLFVFDTDRISYTVIRAKMSAMDFGRLQKIVSEKHTVVVEKRAGLPFLLGRLFARKALLVGLILIAAAVAAASLFVWDVRVLGVEDGYEITAELEDYGVALGAYKKSVDLKEIATKIIIEHDEIAWIDISFKGVVVVVEIVPALPVPELVDDTRPCDVVAKKDAYITSITARSGRANVLVGDTVRKGDVLISGLIWDPGKPRMMFAARGEVVGSVWYTGKVAMPIFEETRKQTGAVQLQRVIFIGGDSADVDEGCSFEEYDTRVVDEYYLGGKLFLPVRVVTYEHSEVEITRQAVSLELLKVICEEKAYRQAQAKIGQDAQIIGHQAFFEISEDMLTVTVYVQTSEDIGKIVYLKE